MPETPQTAAVQVDVTKIVEAHIRTAVMDALAKSGPDLIAKFVNHALTTKTSGRSGYGQEKPAIEHAVAEMVQEAGRQAVSTYVASVRAEFEAEVVKQLRNSVKGMAKMLTTKFVEGLEHHLDVSVNLVLR